MSKMIAFVIMPMDVTAQNACKRTEIYSIQSAEDLRPVCRKNLSVSSARIKSYPCPRTYGAENRSENFCLLHKGQPVFPGETSLSFGSNGFKPSIR